MIFIDSDTSEIRTLATHAARGGDLTLDVLRLARRDGMPLRYDGLGLLRVSDALPLARLVVQARATT